MLQGGDCFQVLGELCLHPRQAVLIELPGRGQGLRVRQGCVQPLPPLFPHIEDGALLGQAGQHFLCAGEEGRHVIGAGDAVLPQEGELRPVSFGFHHLLPEAGRYAGWILPLPDLPQ